MDGGLTRVSTGRPRTGVILSCTSDQVRRRSRLPEARVVIRWRGKAGHGFTMKPGGGLERGHPGGDSTALPMPRGDRRGLGAPVEWGRDHGGSGGEAWRRGGSVALKGRGQIHGFVCASIMPRSPASKKSGDGTLGVGC